MVRGVSGGQRTGIAPARCVGEELPSVSLGESRKSWFEENPFHITRYILFFFLLRRWANFAVTVEVVLILFGKCMRGKLRQLWVERREEKIRPSVSVAAMEHMILLCGSESKGGSTL